MSVIWLPCKACCANFAAVGTVVSLQALAQLPLIFRQVSRAPDQRDTYLQGAEGTSVLWLG